MKGQAALEYLVTYGWAFLTLVVTLGALAYFGYLSPSKYLPARCDFGAQLECVDSQLIPASAGNNGEIRLLLRNNFGDDINISNIYFDRQAQSGEYLFDPPSVLILRSVEFNITKGIISSQISAVLESTDQISLEAGDRASVPVTIEFRRDVTGAPYHNITGEIFATVRG